MNTNRFAAKMLFKTLLLVIFLTVTGCGPGQFLGPTLTPIPTDTPIPTLTATSSPTPTQIPTTTPTATARPTRVPDKIIFSDTFEDNRNKWDLSTSNSIKIEDGLMRVSGGNHGVAGIKIPLESTPNSVMVEVDILPDPPAGADPSKFLYGMACRLNATANDFYFLGVSPAPGVDGFFMATFFQIEDGKLVDYEFAPTPLPRAKSGDGFTATFICDGNNLAIAAGKVPSLEVFSSDLREGDLFLGIYQLEGTNGSVKFDHLTVTEVH